MDAPATPPVGTIALLFTDIEGSTTLARRLGSAWSDLLRTHHALLSHAITSAGGWIDGTEGDAFFATFGDPAAAGRAATSAQRALSQHEWPADIGELKVRMGLHVGHVERNETGYVGLEVHRAARIAGAAHGGQILMSAPAAQMLADVVVAEPLGTHRLKDFPQAEPLFCAVVDGRGAGDFPPPRTESVRPTNLPAGLPTLIGREEDLSRVHEALVRDGERIVTLTGRSGAGKTSLAMIAAAEVLEVFPGGVWFVPLATVTDPAEVMAAIASAVGASTEVDGSDYAAVSARLRAVARTLIVLDNAEHLLAAASEVGRLAAEVPELQLLVTSQAPLRLAEEMCLPLDSLPDGPALELIERVARRRNPRIAFGDQERRTLRDLIALLDGLPLALELAAARLALLSPAQLLARLRDSQDMLRDDRPDRPARQRSVRATVEWSLGLLEPDTLALFRRLGAFAGPVELEELEAVCGGDGLDVIGELFRLLEVALVRRVEPGDGRIRFGLPESLRQIAAEQLERSDDGERWRRSHAERQRQIIWPVRHVFATRTAYDAAVDATPERRLAIRWAQARDPSLAQAIAAPHGILLSDRGRLREALDVLEPIIDELPEDLEVRSVALNAIAWTHSSMGRHAKGIVFGDRAVAAAPGPDYASCALSLRGVGHAFGGDAASCLRDTNEALELARDLEPPFLSATLLLDAQAYLFAGELDRAADLVQQGVRLGESCDSSFHWRRHTIEGDLAAARGELLPALVHYARSLQEAEARAHEMQIAFDLAGTAIVLARLGGDQAAVELDAAVRAMSLELGGPGATITHLMDSSPVAQARDRLGTERLHEAERRGGAIPPAERVRRAVELATLAREQAATRAGSG